MKCFAFFFILIGFTRQCSSQPSVYHPDSLIASFLDDVELRTFRFFWDLTDPNTGLTHDRWPTVNFSSVAAIGFGLTSYPIGAERGYVARDSAANRVLATLKFLWSQPQSPDATGSIGYKGFFYHFLGYKHGQRFSEHVELSSIDTALLIAGALFCQSYFEGTNQIESDIRAYSDSLYRRVDWTWLQVRPPLICMSWTPEHGFNKNDWKGYNEAMIMYILALGSPTHPVVPQAWTEWQRNYIFAEYFGRTFISFGPLFGHQYSHCWIDFRGITDAYMREKSLDYAENSRRATYSQRDYATRNPEGWKDYSDSIWGFTACDGPAWVKLMYGGKERQFESYNARGVSFDWVNDDGTIAPTAAGGSVMFAPEICVPALLSMKLRYGDSVYRKYGFVDAFNPSYITVDTPNGWFDNDYLGIDQGPILISLENIRNGFVWQTMKRNRYLVTGLQRAGFSGGWLDDLR
jgi:hypothetical protein